MTFDAAIEREWAMGIGTVRLHLRERIGAHAARYLSPDGTWHQAEEGAGAVDSGIVLPAEAIEAIAAAIELFQGHSSHADTEARVLREWLESERGRVDRILGRVP